MSNRAAFLDRDGVINRKAPGNGYVTCWEEMHFLPGVAEAIALFNQADFRVVIVSNQRCIARGFVTAQAVDALHRHMCHWLAAAGARIDGVYYCPHGTQPPCKCRKPAPGLLLTAAREHQIDLKASWIIGDSDIDVEAGKNGGCKTARVLQNDEIATGSPDLIANSLLTATHQILRRERIGMPLPCDGELRRS
jgi:D-glycero-D-manno-heptose 1,7-bisphosphate phosphatase